MNADIAFEELVRAKEESCRIFEQDRNNVTHFRRLHQAELNYQTKMQFPKNIPKEDIAKEYPFPTIVRKYTLKCNRHGIIGMNVEASAIKDQIHKHRSKLFQYSIKGQIQYKDCHSRITQGLQERNYCICGHSIGQHGFDDTARDVTGLRTNCYCCACLSYQSPYCELKEEIP